MSNINDFDIDAILREVSEGSYGVEKRPESRQEAELKEPEKAPEPVRTAKPGKPVPKPEAPAIAAKARKDRGIGTFPALLFALVTVAVLLWVGLHLRPAAGNAVSAASSGSRTDLVAYIETQLNSTAADALGDVGYIRKMYSIPENDLVAPEPDPACFGSTADPEDVVSVIAGAAELLDGQEMIWSPDIERWEGSDIQYYCDDTILAVAWKEVHDGSMCTYTEIKLADASQLRRFIADNSYGSDIQYLASSMADTANAVVAINGDFYTYRRLGITVYQRQVYRCEPNNVESCFFTADGQMLFSHKGELKTAEEAQQFVDDNDVLFAVAFGPILVENGELKHTDNYAVGEVEAQYSRSCIAQVDELHYMLMTVNIEGGYGAVADINKAAALICDKGVQNAYALDGGQTSVIIFNNRPYNRVDWGNERTMSDIIYFASAIPEEEWK